MQSLTRLPPHSAFLLWQLTRREITGRYRGSYLGIAWSFLHPLLMLIAYTFIFGLVFKARWGQEAAGGTAEFGLTLFGGLIAYNVFAENVVRAPGLILANPNFVKKVVFPLELLPVALLLASLVHALISVAILLVGQALLFGRLPITVLYIPAVLLPLALLSLGLSWLLSSLGVFLRDLSHLATVLVQVLMFVSPVFYPASALPEPYRAIIDINPLSAILENTRRVLIWNMAPEWGPLGAVTVAGLLVAVIGYLWFKKTQSAFADVV